ncbi:cation diffusion facilitator family transporter [Pyrinomonas methylaliphatogenes]|uniref:Cation diffusion facilitator family transporter n=1 Tax=Pyrinomonas methylaliphatogenes TaxID=454194 RepID=A0A0B6X317_9BACT|nr:cation diffusion facilitator family transporter [Pyrinomonas methylaliphatogenes]MBX5478748.1 cation transporter [Pyrinomonas methylaliphatogenes]CDM66690.1 cation diffusion facilitator family transporter [Pyrinomonas methylaliphatogenes]
MKSDEGFANRADRRLSRRQRLVWVLSLTCLYAFAEAIGGWWTGSLALLADAGHMLTDIAAIALALFAAWFGARPANSRKTYGYYRLEILAAFINGIALVLISILILYEAYKRFLSPPEVKASVMIAIAIGGLVTNLFCAWLLHGEHEHDLNVRGAWLHIIGDALGSVGAIIAGALMLARNWWIADPLFSILITLLIIWSAWRLIREATDVLLEGTPAHINLAAVEEAILETEGVTDVHDLHVWTITSGREALSAHVIHAEGISQPELLRALRAKLRTRFGIDHLTIQMETMDFDDETLRFCHVDTSCFRSTRDQ